MSELWPRLSTPIARAIFEDFGAVTARTLVSRADNTHAQLTYAASGGTRVDHVRLDVVAGRVRDTAARFGYPEPSADRERIAFDRAATRLLFAEMDIGTFEAAQTGVWNFLAVVLLPDVTLWRFGRSNAERWLASDLTRHMFARLWWHGLTFGRETSSGWDFSLLDRLSESDLNQIMERRSLAGNARLAQALARVVIDVDGPRRETIRDITPKLRRRLAFIDFIAVTDAQIDAQVRLLRNP